MSLSHRLVGYVQALDVQREAVVSQGNVDCAHAHPSRPYSQAVLDRVGVPGEFRPLRQALVPEDASGDHEENLVEARDISRLLGSLAKDHDPVAHATHEPTRRVHANRAEEADALILRKQAGGLLQRP